MHATTRRRRAAHLRRRRSSGRHHRRSRHRRKSSRRRGEPEDHHGGEVAQGADQLYTVDVGAELADVLAMMEAHQIRRLPVVDEGVLAGIITECGPGPKSAPEHDGRVRRGCVRLALAGHRRRLKNRSACRAVRRVSHGRDYRPILRKPWTLGIEGRSGQAERYPRSTG